MENLLRFFVLGQELFFDDEDENENSLLEKVENYAEEIVPLFTNTQFKQNFRMTAETFENLLGKMHRHIIAQERHHSMVGHPEISLEKQLMITVWCLANLECFRSVAERFGVSKSTCWDVLQRMCDRIIEMNKAEKLLWWPSEARMMLTMVEFERQSSFPGAVGAIDGSHIRILPPNRHPASYCNRKKFHSVLLQGVCDSRKLFIDVYAGEPGSLHDARLFEKSDLSHRIENGIVQFPNDSHLVGDLAYKLTTKLMVEFKNFGHLTNRQKNFNTALSKTRVVIENCFGLLKGCFRRLKYMETVRLDIICRMILTACILHNICILNGDPVDDIMDIQAEVEEERRLQVGMGDIIQDYQGERREAVIKRNNICNALPIAVHQPQEQ